MLASFSLLSVLVGLFCVCSGCACVLCWWQRELCACKADVAAISVTQVLTFATCLRCLHRCWHSVPRSCQDVKAMAEHGATSGTYVVYPDGPTSDADGVSVWCDFDTTDGNGWTIVYTASGGDSDVAITSDAAVLSNSTDPHATYNVPRHVKVALSAGSASEVLLWRSPRNWLVLSKCDGGAVFGPRFAAGLEAERRTRCVAHSSDSSTGAVIVAWNTMTGASAGHGDFAVLRADAGGFDRAHVGSGAPLLNTNCSGHVVYSRVATSPDGLPVVVLGAAAGFGAWQSPQPGCVSNTSGMALRIGVRRSRGGAWTPLLRRATFRSRRLASQQVLTSARVDPVRLKVTYRDGYLTCGGQEQEPPIGWHPWDGCGHQYTLAPGEAGFSMDLYHNEDALAVSSGVTDVPTACHHAAESVDGAGSVVCDTAVAIHPDDTFGVRPHVSPSHSPGSVAVDVDAFVEDHCPLPASPLHGSLVGCSPGSRWVKVLPGVSYTAQAGQGYAASIGVGGTFTVSAVRAVPVSGFLGCSPDAAHANASDADMWNRCGFARADGTPVVLFELHVGGIGVVQQGAADETAAGCAVGPPGSELFTDVSCTTDFTLRHGDLVNVTWHDARIGYDVEDNTETELVVDVWALVTRHVNDDGDDSPSTLSFEPLLPPVLTSRGRGWHLLLGSAWVDAALPSHLAPPMFANLGGREAVVVSRLRAVPREGALGCNASLPGTDEAWVWNTCKPFHGALGTGGLDVRRNGTFVLEMPGAGVADSRCAPVVSSNGALTCNVSFTLHATDVLTFSWFGARDAATAEDGTGVLYFDLWAWLEDRPTLEGSLTPATRPVSAHDTCTFACDAGFELLGPATRTCSGNGSWTGAQPSCLALAPFEVQESQATALSTSTALLSTLPALHTWTFDGTALGADEALVAESSSGVHGVVVGAPSAHGMRDTGGCAVGHCATVSTCGAGLRSPVAFDAALLGGNHPKSVSVWVRQPATSVGHSTPSPSPSPIVVTPVVSFGGTHVNTSTGDVSSACAASFAVVLVNGVPAARTGRHCGEAAAAADDDDDDDDDGGDVDALFLRPDADAMRVPVSSHRWTHVVLTHDGHTTRLYIDAQLAAQRVGRLATRSAPGHDHIRVGGDTWGPTAGAVVQEKHELACSVAVDEIRVAPFAFSASEVEQLRAAALRCPALVPPARGRWSCAARHDGGDGDVHTGTSVMPGDTCTLVCASGTTPSVGTRTCLPTGVWSAPTGELDAVCFRGTPWEAGDITRRALHVWSFDDAHVASGSVVVMDTGRAGLQGTANMNATATGLPLRAGVVNMTSVALVYHSPAHTGVASGSGASLHFLSSACALGNFSASPQTVPVAPFLTTSHASQTQSVTPSAMPVTTSLWFRVAGHGAAAIGAQVDASMPLFYLGGESQEHMAAFYNHSSGKITASALQQSASVGHSANSVAAGEWVHVGVVLRQASATTCALELFVQGVQADTAVFSCGGDHLFSTSTKLNLGRDPSRNLTTCGMYLDDVRVYDRAVHPAELLALARAGLGQVGVGMEANVHDIGDLVFNASTMASTPGPSTPSEGMVAVCTEGTMCLMHSGGIAQGSTEHSVWHTNRSSTPVSPGQHIVLQAVVRVNSAFRCQHGSCPILSTQIHGAATLARALVQVELSEELVRDSQGDSGAATIACHVVAPPGASHVDSVQMDWSSSSTSMWVTGGVLSVVHMGVALQEPPLHANMAPDTLWAVPMKESAAHTEARHHNASHVFTCHAIGRLTLNARRDAPLSCGAARAPGMHEGSMTVTSPSGPSQHRLAHPLVLGAVWPHRFSRPLLHARVGDVLALQARLTSPTAPTARAQLLGCATGAVRATSQGDWVRMVPISLRGVALHAQLRSQSQSQSQSVVLGFDARVESGSQLTWQVVEHQTGFVVASGDMSNGTTPGEVGAACIAVTRYCRFEVDLSAAQVSAIVSRVNSDTNSDAEGPHLFIETKPSLSAPISGSFARSPNRGVWVKRVMLTVPAQSSLGEWSVNSQDWHHIGTCVVASTAGGVSMLYNVNVSSAALEPAWEARVQHHAMQSGACTLVV